MTINECIVGNETYNGNYLYTLSKSGVSGKFNPGLSIYSDTGVVQNIAGLRYRSNSEALPNGRIGWRIGSYISGNSDELSLSDFNTKASYNDTRTDSAGFRQKEFMVRADIQADWTSGNTLRLRTINFFAEFGDNLTYQFGSFTVLAEDGTSLIVNADNGDPATFQVDASGNGLVDSSTFSWGDKYVLPCSGTPRNESGCRVEL